VTDPYIDPDTGVLRNRLGISDPAELAAVESELAAYRELQLYLSRPVAGTYDLAYVRAIHRWLFADIYPWAGELRTIDITKGMTLFRPRPRHPAWGRRALDPLAGEGWLRGLDRDRFVRRAGALLADLNTMHPFREGNGRTQRAFLNRLANNAGWALRWQAVTAVENTRASRAAMEDDTRMVETGRADLRALRRSSRPTRRPTDPSTR